LTANGPGGGGGFGFGAARPKLLIARSNSSLDRPARDLWGGKAVTVVAQTRARVTKQTKPTMTGQCTDFLTCFQACFYRFPAFAVSAKKLLGSHG
jgi:hypothetical protein